MVMCILQLVPLQTWTVFPTLIKWWLLQRLVPQKIPVDKDVILPYFLNIVEAVPGEFNVTPFAMAHNIPFHELKARVALHIWPHYIKLSPAQSDPYYIPNDMC
jgi:hypothetical protein